MVRAQDSAIEYLLALQAKPRPRRVVCCNPGVFAVCNPGKCACAEVMTCATDIDASFSSQGSESAESEAEISGQVVREAHVVQARPARLTQPSRISVVQVPTRAVVQPVQVQRVSVIQGPGTPRSQAVGLPSGKANLSASQIPIIAGPTLSAAGSSRSLQQAWDLGSPCSTRSAPVLAEARSIAALPAMRWNSAATALTGSQRVQVKVTSTTPVSTPRSTQTCAQVTVTPRSAAYQSHQPPRGVDVHDKLTRSRSWQPSAAPTVASLTVLLPVRYTVGSAALKRPPMAQVVA